MNNYDTEISYLTNKLNLYFDIEDKDSDEVRILGNKLFEEYQKYDSVPITEISQSVWNKFQDAAKNAFCRDS